MKYILLTNSISRIEFECIINKQPFLIWVDTGSPNTLISEIVREQLKLDPNKGRRFNGNIAGGIFKNAPSVTIPAINIQNKSELKNIRAIVGLPNKDEWKNTIILGMNVLNHCTFMVDKTELPYKFSCLESIHSRVEDSFRTKFDHVLIDNQYLLDTELSSM